VHSHGDFQWCFLICVYFGNNSRRIRPRLHIGNFYMVFPIGQFPSVASLWVLPRPYTMSPLTPLRIENIPLLGSSNSPKQPSFFQSPASLKFNWGLGASLFLAFPLALPFVKFLQRAPSFGPIWSSFQRKSKFFHLQPPFPLGLKLWGPQLGGPILGIQTGGLGGKVFHTA